MLDFFKPLLKDKSSDFSVEERNMLSVAFKSLIGAKRTAIRTIAAISESPKYKNFGDALSEYKSRIEGELR